MRNDAVWWSNKPAPPHFPNVVTLAADATDAQLAAIFHTTASVTGPFAMKDSFCRLDLGMFGCRIAFDATWLWTVPTGSASAPAMPAGWQRITEANALAAWEAAWSSHGSPTTSRVFPEAILGNPAIAIFGRIGADRFDAGCIANRSPGAVGLSNVFAAGGLTPAIYAAATGAASSFAPRRPLTGYERGDALRVATAAGFEQVGALRVWLSG